MLENIMVGEVWVCSGQSNMEFNYGWGSPKMKEELSLPSNPNIRFLTLPRTTAEAPQDDCKTGGWTNCDSNTIKTFSAVGYYFGKALNHELNVPIGLINTSWGGTPAEAWTPAEKIYSDSILIRAARKQNHSRYWPITPGFIFNGMIAPIINFAIAGAIWYQGESNTGTASTYDVLLQTMIGSWRQKWAKEFPFYYVQIAPFHYGNKNIAALLREAQTKVLTTPKTGMAVITDLAEDTLDIHPKNKKDVGFRLAKLALFDTYGIKVTAAKSPLFKSIQRSGNKMMLEFENDSSGLVVRNSAVKGLYIAGNDHLFYPAQAIYKNSKLMVWSKKVKAPVAVRYAFGNTAVGNLFSKESMPVAPFRTDNWEVDTSAE